MAFTCPAGPIESNPRGEKLSASTSKAKKGKEGKESRSSKGQIGSRPSSQVRKLIHFEDAYCPYRVPINNVLKDLPCLKEIDIEYVKLVYSLSSF